MLAAGSVLGFGRADGDGLVDAGEPVAFAEPDGGGEPIESLGGILALPDPDAPAAMIFRTGATWSMDQAGEVVPIADGATVQIGTSAFRVLLPEALPPTANAAPSTLQLDDLHLRLRPSGLGASRTPGRRGAWRKDRGLGAAASSRLCLLDEAAEQARSQLAAVSSPPGSRSPEPAWTARRSGL